MNAGFCEAAIVGGVDSLCQMTLYGFNSLQLVSAQPCRPADRDRDGLNIGEAAGFALLEWQESDRRHLPAGLRGNERRLAHVDTEPGRRRRSAGDARGANRRRT